MSVVISHWLFDERLKPGRRVFAVGDVHGRPVELDLILAAMATAASTPLDDATEATEAKDTHLVLLGDLIDRGPDSPGAIAMAAEWLTGNAFTRRTLLIGNHDLFYFSAVAGHHRAFRSWSINGAEAFLKAVGATGLHDVRECLINKIGLEAVTIYEAAETHIEIGNLLFVHAGVPPSAALEDIFAGDKWRDDWVKNGDDWHWAWIRLPFLEHEGPFKCDRIVVHGHTSEQVIMEYKGKALGDSLHQIDGWRLGLDGNRGDAPSIAGAEIEDGRYRIYTVPLMSLAAVMPPYR
jgi:serine/threonine protein phosphatase 1